jgi:hypothetical protein
MEGLDFVEAPDYASVLEKEFQRINRAWDENEEAEKENDQRRIAAAKQPIEALEKLGEFAPKAFDLADKIHQESQQGQIRYAAKAGYSNEEIELAKKIYKEGDKILLADHLEKQKLAKKAEENGEEYKALTLMSQSEWRKGRFGFLRQGVIYNDAANFQKDFHEQHPGFKSYDVKTASNAVKDFIEGVRDKYSNYPQALANYALDQAETVGSSLLQESISGNLKIAKELNDKEQFFRIMGVFKNQEGEDFKENVVSLINELKLDDKFSGGLDILLNHLISGVHSGQLSTTQARKVEEIFLEHFGKEGKLENLTDIHARVFEKVGWEDKLNEAEGKYIDTQLKKIENKSSAAVIDYKKWELNILEKENRLPNIEEKKAKIREYQDQGIIVPDQVVSAITKESRTQEEAVAHLTEKYKRKDPNISYEDLNGLEDPSLIAFWKSKIDTKTEWSIDATTVSTIKTNNLKSRLEDQDDYPGYTENEKVEILDMAEASFIRFYSEAYENEPNKAAAIEVAKERTYELIDNGTFKKILETPSNKESLYSIQVETAKLYLAQHPNSVNTELIPGSQDVLEEARKDPNTVQLFYKQIAKGVKGLNGRDIQLAQLALEKGEKPLISKIDEEVNKLNDGWITTLLKYHPDKGRVLRAKLKAFSDDGKITYDELATGEWMVIPEAQEAYNKKYGIATLGKLEGPQKGDYKKIKNLAGYAYYNGKKWVFKVGKGEGKEYHGNVESYTDFGGIEKKFDNKFW